MTPEERETIRIRIANPDLLVSDPRCTFLLTALNYIDLLERRIITESKWDDHWRSCVGRDNVSGNFYMGRCSVFDRTCEVGKVLKEEMIEVRNLLGF